MTWDIHFLSYISVNKENTIKVKKDKIETNGLEIIPEILIVSYNFTCLI